MTKKLTLSRTKNQEAGTNLRSWSLVLGTIL